MDADKLYKGIGPCSGKTWKTVLCDGKFAEKPEVCEDPDVKQTRNYYQFHEKDASHEEEGCCYVLQSHAVTSFHAGRKKPGLSKLASQGGCCPLWYGFGRAEPQNTAQEEDKDIYKRVVMLLWMSWGLPS